MPPATVSPSCSVHLKGSHLLQRASLLLEVISLAPPPRGSSLGPFSVSGLKLPVPLGAPRRPLPLPGWGGVLAGPLLRQRHPTGRASLPTHPLEARLKGTEKRWHHLRAGADKLLQSLSLQGHWGGRCH